ncbi:MAG: DUF4349 domain-containing protein [Pseudomonadota bacterium]
MRTALALAAAVAIGGCSAETGPGSSQTTSTEAARQSAAPDTGAKAADGAPAPVKVSLPQLAYSYRLGFLVPGDKLAGAQEAHRALCEQMGPARCQLLALERGAGQDVTAGALLKVRVAGNEARGFQEAATKSVAQAGGRVTDTNVAAEDVSKDIVDAQARIAQRELLVARLTEILRSRAGKVAELVEAERSVAQAQEELDQAKAWLTELQGRVAMSDFEIRYTAVAASASAGSVGGQLGEATQGSAATFLIGLRGLLTIAIYLVPWLLLAIPVILVVRRLRRKRADPPAGEG